MIFNINNYLLPCLNKTLLGIDCPGCGIQRATLALLKGDFTTAFNLYPAIFTLILLALVFIVNKIYAIKYANKIMFTLAIVNTLIIGINYSLKMIHLFNY